jgi:hypothetical protein
MAAPPVPRRATFALAATVPRRQLLSGIHASLILGRDPVVLLILRAVTMAGHVHRRHREATLGHEAARTSHDLRGPSCTARRRAPSRSKDEH